MFDEPLQKVSPGDEISAALFNKLYKRAARGTLTPGSFQCGDFVLQRQIGGPGGGGGTVSLQFGYANETIGGLLKAQPEPDPIVETYPPSDPFVDFPVVESMMITGQGEFILLERVPVPEWPDPDENPETDPAPEWYPPDWPIRLREALDDPELEPEPRVPENFKKVRWNVFLPGAILERTLCIAINGVVISACPVTIRKAPE